MKMGQIEFALVSQIFSKGISRKLEKALCSGCCWYVLQMLALIIKSSGRLGGGKKLKGGKLILYSAYVIDTYLRICLLN